MTSARSTQTLTNALTIDLEDWAQAAVRDDLPITSRVVKNLARLLDLLDRKGVRATFFALGKACREHPDLLPAIASAGHEIATHGFGHELVHRMTPESFVADLKRSIELIEQQTGRRPVGYRAPAFSVTRSTPWVGPILTEHGIRYSSSIFPIAGRRYGIAGAPRFPHRWPTCDLVEFPLTTIRRLGRNFPVAGGGYLRLLPGRIVSGAIREVNRGGHPAVVYIHPYEMDVNEPSELRRQGWPITWRKCVQQSMFRGRVQGRLTALLDSFRFSTMASVLGFED